MLDRLFLQILNMSFTASVVILFVLAARLLLKKTPKIFSYALWAVVLFRLVCPFSFESIFSFLPGQGNPISQDIVYAAAPKIDTGIMAVNAVNAVNSSLLAPTSYASINSWQVWMSFGKVLWLMGIAALLIYSIVSLWKLQKRLSNAAHERDNIYIAEQLDTPFVMGLFHPKIYLPAALSPEEKQYILLHEQTHIRRFDHVVKILSFFVLCLHWFNPLVWVAFFASGRDMEMACDEAVLKRLGDDVKKDYSSSLLALATGRRIVGGAPLAFGEGDTKGRIKNVLNYKKPAFWAVALALVAVVCISVGLMANPVATRTSMQWAKNLKAGDIEKIELVVMPSEERERYTQFERSEYEAIVALANKSRGKYIKTPERINGSSLCFYITTIDGVRHQVCNSGNYYLIIDGDFYEGGYNWLSSWEYTRGNAPLPEAFDFGNDKQKPALTMDTLQEIVKKGTALSWEDFSDYKSEDVGSGLYIRHYGIDERFYLLIGGPNLEEAPWYIRLQASGTDQYIELGQGDIGTFIESMGDSLLNNEEVSFEKTEVPPRVYTWQESEEPIKPSVTLKEDEFQFMYSLLSSYIAWGTYEIDHDTLILKTYDKKYTYLFKIKEDTLIFNQKESSGMPSYTNLPDEAVFSSNGRL